MMKKKGYINKFLLVMAGIGIVLSFFLLTGADTGSPIGRYQLEVVMRGNFPDLFVIDTFVFIHGVIKWL